MKWFVFLATTHTFHNQLTVFIFFHRCDSNGRTKNGGKFTKNIHSDHTLTFFGAILTQDRFEALQNNESFRYAKPQQTIVAIDPINQIT